MFSKDELDDLLYSVPEYVDYTTIVEDIDIEDIPQDRIDKLIYILNNKMDFEFIHAFKAAGVLCHWGEEHGFEYIYNLLNGPNSEFIREKFLCDYDCEYILSALKSYRAYQCDIGNEESTREKIYPCVKRLIEYAMVEPFSLVRFYYLIEDGYLEYIPLIKQYFSCAITKKESNYWDVYDTAKLLLKIDRDFVEDTFMKNNKKLSDFGLN